MLCWARWAGLAGWTRRERLDEEGKEDVQAREDGLREANVFVAIVTDNGQDSYFSREFRRQEVQLALDAGKIIVPVVRREDKLKIGKFIAEGKGLGLDFSGFDFCTFDRSTETLKKTIVDEILANLHSAFREQQDAFASIVARGGDAAVEESSQRITQGESKGENKDTGRSSAHEVAAQIPAGESYACARGGKKHKQYAPEAGWGFFLSHTQSDPEAKLMAKELYSSLGREGKSCWLDVEMDKRDVKAMEQGVRKSDIFIAIVTDNGKDSFFRDFCRQEVQWALDAGKKIIPVVRREDKLDIDKFIAEGNVMA